MKNRVAVVNLVVGAKATKIETSQFGNDWDGHDRNKAWVGIDKIVGYESNETTEVPDDENDGYKEIYLNAIALGLNAKHNYKKHPYAQYLYIQDIHHIENNFSIVVDEGIVSLNYNEKIVVSRDYNLFKMVAFNKKDENLLIRKLTEEEILNNRYEYNGVFYPIFAEDENTPSDDDETVDSAKQALVESIKSSVDADGFVVGGPADGTYIGKGLSDKSLDARVNALVSDAYHETHPDLYSGCTWEDFKSRVRASVEAFSKEYTVFDTWLARFEDVKITDKYIQGTYEDGRSIRFNWCGGVWIVHPSKKETSVDTFYTDAEDGGHKALRISGRVATDCTLERAVLGLYTVYNAMYNRGKMPLTFRGLEANCKDGSGGKMRDEYNLIYNIHPSNLEWVDRSLNSKHFNSFKKLLNYGRNPKIGGKLGFPADFKPVLSAYEIPLERIIREGSPEDALWWYSFYGDK